MFRLFFFTSVYLLATIPYPAVGTVMGNRTNMPIIEEKIIKSHITCSFMREMARYQRSIGYKSQLSQTRNGNS